MSFTAIIMIAVIFKIISILFQSVFIDSVCISLTRKLSVIVAFWGTKANYKSAAADSSKGYHTAQSLNFIRN